MRPLQYAEVMPRTDDGYGLVELIIATGLFVTLAAGGAGLLGATAHSVLAARERTVSTALAADLVDTLQGRIVRGVRVEDGEGVVDANGLSPARAGGETVAYLRTWSLGPWRSDERLGVIRVRVSPTIGPGGGRVPHGVELATVVRAP